MKYKNEEIGIPTLETIQSYIDECKLSVTADEVIDYWKKKNFLTKKGTPVSTLESMVHVVNSIVVRQQRKGMSNNISKNDALIKAKDWLIKNAPTFLEVMETIRKENPTEWERLYSEMVKLGKNQESSSI